MFGTSAVPTTTSFQPTTMQFGSGTTAVPSFGSLPQTAGGGFSSNPASTQAQQPAAGFGGGLFGASVVAPLAATATSLPSAAPATGSAQAQQAPSTTGSLFGSTTQASSGAASTALPAFGAPGTSTTASSFSFGAAPAAPAQPTLPAASIPVRPPISGGFSFGASQPTPVAPVSSATPAVPSVSSDAKPVLSLASSSAPLTTIASNTAADPKQAFSFKVPEAPKPSVPSSTAAGVSEKAKEEVKPTSTVPATPGAASHPLSSLSTLPSSISFPSNLKNKTLEEIIIGWNDELETLVGAFERQAVEIAQWDKKIVHNGEHIIALNERANKLEAFQKEIDQSLGYVIAQQTELEGLLDGIDKELPGLQQAVTGGKLGAVDVERDRMYESAESVQTQVIDVANQLSKMIYEINTAASSEPPSANAADKDGQSLVEITQILNAHLDALQWIDRKVDELRQASVTVKNQASKASSEMERFSNPSQ